MASSSLERVDSFPLNLFAHDGISLSCRRRIRVVELEEELASEWWRLAAMSGTGDGSRRCSDSPPSAKHHGNVFRYSRRNLPKVQEAFPCSVPAFQRYGTSTSFT